MIFGSLMDIGDDLHVTPTLAERLDNPDPLTYIAVCAALTAAAVFASYVPARRATSVNPVRALRAE